MRGLNAERARRWMRGTRGLLGLLIVLAPAPLAASTRSQILYAKGLIPFARGQWDDAARLLDAAVKADPQDAMAVYYRGLVAARRGEWPLAVQDIERAKLLRPELPDAALDLGIILYETQDYPRAEQWLQRAYREASTRFAAALFLGLVRYRGGDDAGALTALAEAEADPRLRATARYYHALALLRQGQREEGRRLFAQIEADSAQEEVGKVAAEYLAGRRVIAEPGAPAPRRWSAHGDVGIVYDSNVVLAADDETIQDTRGIEDEGDSGVTLCAGADYRAFENDSLQVRVAYDGYQSVHFTLTEWDLQSHRLRLDVAAPPRRVQYGLTGLYDFYALNYRSYFQQGIGLPWVAFFESDWTATQAYYRVRGRDYFREPFEPFLDAINQAFGVRQFVLLGTAERVLTVGYQFDAEDPVSKDGDDFEYLGHQFDVTVEWPVPRWCDLTAGYVLRIEDYQELNSRSGTSADPAGTEERNDDAHQIVLRATRALGRRWTASLTYLGILNASNLDPFEYNRQIVWGGLQYRF